MPVEGGVPGVHVHVFGRTAKKFTFQDAFCISFLFSSLRQACNYIVTDIINLQCARTSPKFPLRSIKENCKIGCLAGRLFAHQSRISCKMSFESLMHKFSSCAGTIDVFCSVLWASCFSFDSSVLNDLDPGTFQQ